MSNNGYATDVSGREATAKETGNPQQKSWTILLERKLKDCLVKNGRGAVSVAKVQQPLNGQWLIVINETILVHKPGKTAVSVYRAEGPVTADTIQTMIFKNLLSDTNLNARVKNETEVSRLVLKEVDRDLGLLAEESSKSANMEDEIERELEKEEPKAPVRKAVPKKASRIPRRAALDSPDEDEEEDDSRGPSNKPEQEMFGPLLLSIKDVAAFKRLGCLLVNAVDNTDNSVSWAVNVYVPVIELVSGEMQIVEHLHLLTVIDEFSRSLAESDLAESTCGPMALQLDEAEMKNDVTESIDLFFADRATMITPHLQHKHLAIPQEDIGLSETSLMVFAAMAGPLQRQSVVVKQMCKHPVPAVANLLSRQHLKTVYFGKAIQIL